MPDPLGWIPALRGPAPHSGRPQKGWGWPVSLSVGLGVGLAGQAAADFGNVGGEAVGEGVAVEGGDGLVLRDGVGKEFADELGEFEGAFGGEGVEAGSERGGEAYGEVAVLARGLVGRVVDRLAGLVLEPADGVGFVDHGPPSLRSMAWAIAMAMSTA